MRISIAGTPEELGRRAAAEAAAYLNEAIRERGEARLLLSTGASQFTTLEALVREDVDWSKVDMFHLDEYIGLNESHPASFVRYLKERFVSQVPVRRAFFVDPSQGVETAIARLTAELDRAPIDVGLIGIGENAHIAFNDPPADFEDQAAYKVVTLDERCRRQQLGEGWFPTLEDVPAQAISMTVDRILRCRHILSAVPYAVKAQAVSDTVSQPVNNMVPATILKRHASMTLFLSVSMLKDVCAELTAGGYPEDTPVAVVYKATWPEQKVVRGTLADIAEKAAHIKKTALILVGDFLRESDKRSKLYDPAFAHACREAETP